MLLQIMPEQVIQFKDMVKEAIEAAIPPVPGESVEKLNNIMVKLLSGEMTCWIIYRKLEDGSKESIGLMITKRVYDDVTETCSLLIYCLYIYKASNDKDWIEGFEALRKFGSKFGCSRITGYIQEDLVMKRVLQFGGGVEYSFISIPLT